MTVLLLVVWCALPGPGRADFPTASPVTLGKGGTGIGSADLFSAVDHPENPAFLSGEFHAEAGGRLERHTGWTRDGSEWWTAGATAAVAWQFENGLTIGGLVDRAWTRRATSLSYGVSGTSWFETRGDYRWMPYATRVGLAAAGRIGNAGWGVAVGYEPGLLSAGAGVTARGRFLDASADLSAFAASDWADLGGLLLGLAVHDAGRRLVLAAEVLEDPLFRSLDPYPVTAGLEWRTPLRWLTIRAGGAVTRWDWWDRRLSAGGSLTRGPFALHYAVELLRGEVLYSGAREVIHSLAVSLNGTRRAGRGD